MLTYTNGFMFKYGQYINIQAFSHVIAFRTSKFRRTCERISKLSKAAKLMLFEASFLH